VKLSAQLGYGWTSPKPTNIVGIVQQRLQFERGLLAVGNFDTRLDCEIFGFVEIGTPNLFAFSEPDIFDNEVIECLSTLQLAALRITQTRPFL
jgi:hypothetical protein